MLEQIVHEYYEQVDSTNDRIKARAHDGAAEGLVISAGHQTAGKGRVGRVWESPSHDSIATSMLLRPTDVPVEAVATITIVAAMAVRKALEVEYGLAGEIKWPNDIVVNKKKICGILTEMEMKDNKVWFVVSGIGVNVHNKSFAEDIAFKATSVDLALKEMGSKATGSRSQLTKSIWEHFCKYYNQYLQTFDLTYLKDEYEAHLANKGARVRIEDPSGAYEAVALGINNKGALVIDVDGKQSVIETGEVSVRGIYGYV